MKQRQAWLRVSVERIPPMGPEFEAWCKEPVYGDGSPRASPLSDRHCYLWELGAEYGRVYAGSLLLRWDGDAIGCIADEDDDLRYDDNE